MVLAKVRISKKSRSVYNTWVRPGCERIVRDIWLYGVTMRYERPHLRLGSIRGTSQMPRQ